MRHETARAAPPPPLPRTEEWGSDKGAGGWGGVATALTSQLGKMGSDFPFGKFVLKKYTVFLMTVASWLSNTG